MINLSNLKKFKLKNLEIKNYNINIIEKQVKILKNNEVYRFGDAIHNTLKKNVREELRFNKIYSNTLLRKYYNTNIFLNPNVKTRYRVLNNVTLQFIKENNIKTYDESNLLVHLRSGDDYLNRGIGCKKVKENILNNIDILLKKNNKINTIIIVTALHYGHSSDQKFYKGDRYLFNEQNKINNFKEINNLINYIIKKYKCKVKIISNYDSDIDFCILSTCKNLITSEGGFSKIIQGLNRLNNLNKQ